MNAERKNELFEGWAILELMGHRRFAGKVSEAVIGGTSFVRLDVPSTPPVTQFYSPNSIYCLTPTTEDVALRMAGGARPEPVHRWELPGAPEPRNADDAELGEEDMF